MTTLNITIATRESRLALWQAEHVQALLTQLGNQVSLLGMTTQGDQILDRSLSKVGGKGLFVKELEVALEEGRADHRALRQTGQIGEVIGNKRIAGVFTLHHAGQAKAWG
jgi:hypothetical protein